MYCIRPVARLIYGGGGGGALLDQSGTLCYGKWPLWLISFCWTDNLRFKYLDTSFISGIDGDSVYK